MRHLVILVVCVAAVSARADSITIRPGSYAAIAYSPTTGKYSYATDYNSRKAAEAAANAALGTDDAKAVCWTSEGFCALALGDDKTAYGTGWRYGSGASNIEAAKEALKNCNARTTNARIVVCVSTDGKYVFEPEAKKVKQDPPKPDDAQKDPPKADDLMPKVPKLAVGDLVYVTWMDKTYLGRVSSEGIGLGPDVKITVDGKEIEIPMFLCKDVRKAIVNPEPSAVLVFPIQKPADPKTSGVTGPFVRAVLRETDPKAAIDAIAFSDDNRMVAVDRGDGTIHLYKVADGTAAGAPIKVREYKDRDRTIANGALLGMTFARKGQSLVIVSEKTVQVVGTDGRGPDTLLSGDSFLYPTRKYVAFAVSPDKGTIAVASTRSDGFEAIFFFDLAAKGPPSRSTWIGLERIDVGVDAIAYSPDGKRLAINGVRADKVMGRQFQVRTVELWDVPGRKFLGSPPTNISDERFVAFSPDGKSLVTGRGIRDITAPDGDNWRVLKTATVPTAVAYDPKGKWIATGGADRRLTFWDPSTGEKLASVRAADRSIVALAVSRDGATIATTAAYTNREDSEVTLWDVAAILKAAPKEEALAKLAATPQAADAVAFGLGWAQDVFDSVRTDGPKEASKDTTGAAKSLGVTVPEFPLATSGREFLTKFRSQVDALVAEIKKRHGANHEQLFALGVELNFVTRIYRPNAVAAQRATVDGFLKNIEKCCRDLGLTEAVVRRLTDRIAANDTVTNVEYEAAQIYKEVRAILVGESGPSGK